MGGQLLDTTLPRRRTPGGHDPDALSFSELKQQKLVFLITRQLAVAQFARADRERTQALWQEAAALELDPDRIIHLLYGVADPADDREMDEVDRGYRLSQCRPPARWWGPKWGSLTARRSDAWHRSAPPAEIPTRR